jgi:hypothetical protein
MIILVVVIAVVVAVRLRVGKDTTSRNGGRPEQDRVRIQAELSLWQLLLLLLLWYCHIGCIHSVVVWVVEWEQLLLVAPKLQKGKVKGVGGDYFFTTLYVYEEFTSNNRSTSYYYRVCFYVVVLCFTFSSRRPARRFCGNPPTENSRLCTKKSKTLCCQEQNGLCRPVSISFISIATTIHFHPRHYVVS